MMLLLLFEYPALILYYCSTERNAGMYSGAPMQIPAPEVVWYYVYTELRCDML
jgi:hypothetical protein